MKTLDELLGACPVGVVLFRSAEGWSCVWSDMDCGREGGYGSVFFDITFSGRSPDPASGTAREAVEVALRLGLIPRAAIKRAEGKP